MDERETYYRRAVTDSIGRWMLSSMAVVWLAWSGRPKEGRGLVCCMLKLPSKDHYGGATG